MVRIDCFALFVSTPPKKMSSLVIFLKVSIVVTSGEWERCVNRRGLQEAPRVEKRPMFLDLNFGNRSVHLILSDLLFYGVSVFVFYILQ